MTLNLEPQLNEHNKEEFPPMHTAEHLLNRTMVLMFGCERSRNAHIERRKSKISYHLADEPNAEEVQRIVERMNELIKADLPVSYEYLRSDQLPPDVATDRLPDDASELLRLVRIGDYDNCLCIGRHVEHTAELGEFILLGTNWDAEKHNFRIRFKLSVK